MRIIAAALALIAVVGPAKAGHYNTEVRQISQSGKGAYEASLTSIGNQLIASWYDTRDGHPEIYMRVLDEHGRPAGAEHRVTHGTDLAYEPDVAALRNNVAIAWYERGAGPSYRAKLALVTRDGKTLWERTLSAAGRDGKNPVVRVVNGEVLVAWLEGERDMDPDVRAQWFDGNGRELAPSQRVAPAGKKTWNLNAAIDGAGQAWVVFDAKAGTRNDELFAARVGRTSSDVTRLTADDGFASKYPDLAFSGSKAALTWFDERDGNQEVYLFVSPEAGLTEGLERKATRVTDTPGESIGAYVAWNGDVVGLAWCDNSIRRQHEVYLATFDARGASIGPAIRLTDNPSSSLIPAIRPWRDGFALVWNEFVAGKADVDGHGDDGRSEVWSAFVRKSR